MIHSNTNSPVSNNLSTVLLDQAESLEAIAQLLHAGLDQGEIQLSASVKACKRDLELYSDSLRIVSAQIDHPDMLLSNVLIAPTLRARLQSRLAKGANETNIGELLEDYVFCGLEMMVTSLACLSSSDGGSRCLIQASIWMDETYAEHEPLFEQVCGYWNSLGRQELAA